MKLVLIAEDVLLLATDCATGKTRDREGRLDYALAGALLSDLELVGAARLTTSNSSGHRKSRVVVEASSSMGDALLEAAVRSLTRRDRSPVSAVTIVKKGLRQELFRRLVDAGVLRRDRRHLLGLFPITRYPAVDSTSASASRAAITHDFVHLGRSDPRTSAVIACLAVAGGVPDVVAEVHPMLTRPEIRRRAREYLDAYWPAQAALAAYQADASAV